MLSSKENEIARTVLKNLKGERYKDWNYLFLTPFDLDQVPGYLDVVEQPMDLQTVTQNLEREGVYNTLADVWGDIRTTFENAMKYHGERETKWIAKMAKDMLKYFNKERKSAEKSKASSAAAGSTAASTAKPTIKLKIGKQLPTAASKGSGKSTVSTATSDSNSSKNLSKKAPPADVTSSGDKGITSGMAPPKSKKQKLKVKLPTKKASDTPESVPSSTKSSNLGVGGADEGGDEKKAKPSKPVIRLKLKASSTVSSSSNNAPSTMSSSKKKAITTTSMVDPSEDASVTAQSTTSSKSPSAKSSKSNSGKVSVKLGNSRGKELPKGVVQPTTSSKSTTSAASSKAEKAASSKAEKVTSVKADKVSSSKADKFSSKTDKTSKASNKISEKSSSLSSSVNAVSTAPGKAGAKSKDKDTGSVKAGQKRKRPKKSAETSSVASSLKESGRGGGIAPEQLQACAKVLLGLKRRQQSNVYWFLGPVTDKTIIQDYRAKIKHPMDINKMSSKVENKAYKSSADFCLDLRRIFSNCLCFNTSVKDSIRSIAAELLGTAEDLMAFFFSQAGDTTYPKLLFCWKQCLDVLSTLYKLENPNDGEVTVLYFLHPVKVYCGGQFPQDYLEKIEKPMDFQTVTSNLLEGRYQSVSEFAADCKLIVENCNTYYGDREDGRLYVEQANRLATVMNQQLEQLVRYEKSSKGTAEKQKANIPSLTVLRPPVHILTGVLDDLRALKYTDRATKITEPAMGPFEKPVSLAVFPDYLNRISDPMDLQTVEKKTKAGSYPTPEDFEYDMNLVFRNCERYHSERNGEHLVAMAKFATKNFRRILYAKMKTLEEPSSAPFNNPETTTSSQLAAEVPSSSPAGPPAKKQKVDSGGVTKGKVAPRISITLSAAAAASTSRTKSPKLPGQPQKKTTAPPPPPPPPRIDNNQPVPLHIAIARVKEAYPQRRAVKNLKPWETDCARYFKELLRHPWLSAARPKFIFHVPVTMLFPELRDAYAAKIRKPMDLTTVECNLLNENSPYKSCEDLIADVALTFSNAIRFNKDGRDIGDPLSCAYYDASVHLLRYARWLSLELLSAYVVDSDKADEGGADGLPPLSWKLTAKNREIAQKEQMDIVLKEPIEKSLEGDRYTWHESECEKLLKALRHQSDVKYMQYFIRADYPADYTAFISKPMDWEKIQRNLKKRHYDNFGQIIDDLRLIFKNAQKYNARYRDRTDTVSGRAYAAAEYMSVKLENAIRKLMLSVSDRIERERIDHSNAEREMDAEEKAEEARIRAAWKKDPNNKDGSSTPPIPGDRGGDSGRGGGSNKSRMVRRPVVRKEATDFEVPFFDDEDDAQHERSFIDLIKMQKSMFEKQRQELVKMRQTSMRIGSEVFSRHLQRQLAQKWVDEQLKRCSPAEPAVVAPNPTSVETDGGAEKGTSQNPSAVLQELERSDRGQIKISFKAKEKKKINKKRPCPFDDE